MKRREMLLTAGAAMLGASAFPLGWVAAAGKKRQKVLYFTRNVGFYHSVVQRKDPESLSHSEGILVELGKRVGIDVECTKDGRVFDGDLDQYDAFAFYCNNDLTQPNPQQEPPMSPGGKQRFLDAVAGGKGFVAFHSTCACWRTPGPSDRNSDQVDPFIAMLGGEFIAHGPQQKATMRVTSPHFPGMQDLGRSFDLLEEWYAMKNFADDLHVILVQETAGMQGDCYQRPPFPSTWARMQSKGRVFFTSMAHREDVWEGKLFGQIVLGGLAWALGNVDADVTPNVDRVAEGKPVEAMNNPEQRVLSLIHRRSGDPARIQQLGPYAMESLINPDEEGAATAYRVRIGPHQRSSVSYHRVAEEVYFVLAGKGTAILNGEEYPLEAGDFLRLPPGTTHGFVTQHEPLEMLDVHTPGSRPDRDVYFVDGPAPEGFGPA